ncbi:MAG: A/G-specific adenine glycosylase [Desulfobacterales bacterium]|nr:A/G-specific adenine glycosylase [Desulfobacterales bacterium]
MEKTGVSETSKKERRAIRKALVSWFTANQRRLPWRETTDPYHVWVSEVMLQQTQVNTVISYYKRFLDQFPDIFYLAAADAQDVLKCWEGLGYYARARNLHSAARRLVAENQGRIPCEWAAFRKLPGVGDYIASAVLSIAFGKPYPMVDGNVKRVLSRLFAINAPVNRSASYRIFRETARMLLDKTIPGRFNQAVMEVGAIVCKPRRPDCDACPVRRWCRALADDRVAGYPVRIKRTPVPEYRMAIGVVAKGRKLLIVQRPYDGMLGGLWEFPGGVRQSGESAASACARSVGETVGLEVEIESRLTRIRHAYTHFKVVADVFLCRYRGGRVRRNGPIAHQWVLAKGLSRYPLPGSHHKFIPALLENRSI